MLSSTKLGHKKINRTSTLIVIMMAMFLSVWSMLSCLLFLTNLCLADLAIRQSQWYFWTEKCSNEFDDAMIKYDVCVSKLDFLQSCDLLSNQSKLCLEPFELFECSDTSIKRQVRVIGSRESTIQKEILCDNKPRFRIPCIDKISDEVLKRCRPPADIDLAVLCSRMNQTNRCIYEIIDRMCYPGKDVEAAKSYFEHVSLQVICGGKRPATTIKHGGENKENAADGRQSCYTTIVVLIFLTSYSANGYFSN